MLKFSLWVLLILLSARAISIFTKIFTGKETTDRVSAFIALILELITLYVPIHYLFLI